MVDYEKLKDAIYTFFIDFNSPVDLHDLLLWMPFVIFMDWKYPTPPPTMIAKAVLELWQEGLLERDLEGYYLASARDIVKAQKDNDSEGESSTI